MRLGFLLVVVFGVSAMARGAFAAPIDACTLLKDDEVAAVLGMAVTPAQRHDDGEVSGGGYATPGTYSSTCIWHLADDLGSYAILNAMQWPAGKGDAKKYLQSFYDAGKSGMIDQNPTPLKIADGALWWGDGVAVYKGDRSFGISVHFIGKRPAERGLEETLARKIAPRL